MLVRKDPLLFFRYCCGGGCFIRLDVEKVGKVWPVLTSDLDDVMDDEPD